MASRKFKEYEEAPDNYENGPAMKTAKMIALVILIINIAYLCMTIYRIYTVGWDELMQQSQQRMEQWGVQQP